MDKSFCIQFVLVIFLVSWNCANAGSYVDDDDDESAWNRCPWIRNKLKNGRVKIRNRGRVAKFLCDSGYELVGKRFASCVRGQWSNPLPLCVARGCFKLPDVQNGHATQMYRGAVMMYDCNPGYTLEGPNTLYCDGRRWSAVVPDCVLAITNPQMSCDFEDPSLCGWSQDPTHDFDWRRNQFSTPSNHAGTGPSYDHTFGPGKGGYYLYQEASSPRKAFDVSRLFSPVYYMDQSGGCFFFWYHMYGSTIGGLKIYIKPESHVFGELAPSWQLYGDQGNTWFRGNVSVPNFSEYFQIIIEGIIGPRYIGDTAIDDVFLSTLECDEAGNSTEEVTELRSNSCRGRCREEINSTYCGCNDDCHANGNCCFDFMTICTGSNESAEIPLEEQDCCTTVLTSHSSSLEMQSNFTSNALSSTSTALISEHNSSSIINQDTTEYTSTSSKASTSPSITSVTHPLTPTMTTLRIEESVSAAASTKSSTTTEARPITTFASVTNKQTASSTLSSTRTTVSTSTTTSTVSYYSSKISPYTLVTTSTPLVTTPSTTIQAMTIPFTSTTAEISSETEKLIFPSTSSQFSTSKLEESSTNSLVTRSTTPLSSSVSSESWTFAPLPPTVATSTKTPTVPTTSLQPTTSTRRTYNLRPRNRTSYFQPTTTVFPFIQTRPYTTPTRYPTYPTLRFETIPYSRWRFSTSTTRRPWFETMPTRRYFFSTTTQRPITQSTNPTTPKEETSTFKNLLSSQIPLGKNSEKVDDHASKSASRADEEFKSVNALIIAIVIVIAFVVAFGVYLIRRRTIKNQTKLSDDSEMRFLSENEVADYSDPSALDKILVH